MAQCTSHFGEWRECDTQVCSEVRAQLRSRVWKLIRCCNGRFAARLAMCCSCLSVGRGAWCCASTARQEDDDGAAQATAACSVLGLGLGLAFSAKRRGDQPLAVRDAHCTPCALAERTTTHSVFFSSYPYPIPTPRVCALYAFDQSLQTPKTNHFHFIHLSSQLDLAQSISNLNLAAL